MTADEYLLNIILSFINNKIIVITVLMKKLRDK